MFQGNAVCGGGLCAGVGQGRGSFFSPGKSSGVCSRRARSQVPGSPLPFGELSKKDLHWSCSWILLQPNSLSKCSVPKSDEEKERKGFSGSPSLPISHFPFRPANELLSFIQLVLSFLSWAACSGAEGGGFLSDRQSSSAGLPVGTDTNSLNSHRKGPPHIYTNGGVLGRGSSSSTPHGVCHHEGSPFNCV